MCTPKAKSHPLHLTGRKAAIAYLIAFTLSLPIGTFWHEVMGHGLAGKLVGGRVSYLEVCGVQLWPQLGWRGWPDRFGSCRTDGIRTLPGRHLCRLAGSLSTWCVAVLATLLLWAKRWRGLARIALVCLSVWWLDVLTYTLPSWGLRRLIFWWSRYAEPYEAAVALGIPGPLFQAFAVGTSACLLAALVGRLVQDHRTHQETLGCLWRHEEQESSASPARGFCRSTCFRGRAICLLEATGAGVAAPTPEPGGAPHRSIGLHRSQETVSANAQGA